ncbi:hypothetical protein [Telluribacter humicola]|uniref:hypothetical protein n=1 Tax=Telluribacter humicola TaxID=1720261 RepID=UPI001A9571D1|nr:hypothetical protein [Telluribacter humicola]
MPLPRLPKDFPTSVQDWAEGYFTHEAKRLNCAVPIQHAIEAYKLVGKGSIDYKTFIERLKSWAESKGYVYNPKEVVNTRDGYFTLDIPDVSYYRGARVEDRSETTIAICAYIQTSPDIPIPVFTTRKSFWDLVTVDYPLD